VVAIAQLVRAPDCDSGGRGFKSPWSPHFLNDPSMSKPLTPPPIPEFYERNAAFWANARAETDFAERIYVDRLLRERPTNSQVLDLGCGSGAPIGAYLIEKGASVLGCDVSPAMIEMARARFPLSEWRVADMRSLDLGEKFGALIAWDSFFHLTRDEQRSVLPRFREHLRDGGVLLFTSGPEEGEQIGAMNGELLYHASLSPEEYRATLERLGFKEIEFVPKDERCGNHSVWFARVGSRVF
jgi:SAM-dependent methyltransferase